MKSKYIILCLILIYSIMVLPAFAAESFKIEPAPTSFYPFHIPAGDYVVNVVGAFGDGSTIDPVSVQYESVYLEYYEDYFDTADIPVEFFSSSGDSLHSAIRLTRIGDETEVRVLDSQDSYFVPIHAYTFAGSPISLEFVPDQEETIPEKVLTQEDFEAAVSDIVHADLFGSFLICGTLIGLALLRNIHGT